MSQHATTRSSSKIFLSSTGSNKVVNSTTLNTDITFYFDPLLLNNTTTEHFVLGLEQASIPISIYMVNNSNNVMVINGTTYTIPNGNYTAISIKDYLNTIEPTIQFVYNPQQNNFTVTITPTATVVISGTASSILGFVAGSYSNPHTFLGVLNLTSTTGIIVSVENVTTTNRDNSGKTGATLARIPITCPPLRILQYFNSVPFYTQIGNRELTYLRIRLLNDDYSPLVLVGNPPWFIVVRADYSEKTVAEEMPNEFKAMRQKQANDIQEAELKRLKEAMKN
jgi:hypothetical protein